MDNPFEYRELPKTLKDELQLRAHNRERRVAPLAPYTGMGYRITSMCDKCDDVYQLTTETPHAIKNVSTGRILYPKVYGISIKKQGELGTTKKCTISITCFSEEQLYELQKCYFIPGMSVRVEIFTIDAPPPAFPKTLSNNEVILKMSEWTNNTSANYEGLQGVVTNFEYNLDRSGVQLIWVCSLEVVSASASALNHPVSTPCKNVTGLGGPKGTIGQQCETSVPGPDGNERLEVRSTLYNHFKLLNSVSVGFSDNLDYLKKIDKSISKNTYKKYFKDNAGRSQIFTQPYCLIKYRGTPRKRTTTRAVKDFFTGDGVNYASEYYITWGRLELLINELVYNGAGKTVDALNSHTILNSEGVLLPWIDNYISTDPRVCVLADGKWQDYLYYQGTTTNYNIYKPKLYTAGGIVTNIDGSKSLHLHHVLLNVVMLEMVLDEVEGEGGDGLISTFLQKVLDQITAATGGVWELLVTADPVPQTNLVAGSDAEKIYKNAFAHLTIIEMKGNGGTKAATPYAIPSNTMNEDGSVIMKLDFHMKMTDAMKTQAIYSKTPLSSNACAAAAHTAFTIHNNFKNLANGSPYDKELEPCKPCENNFESEKVAPSYAQWMLNFKNGEEAWKSRYLFESVFDKNIIPPEIEDVTVASLLKVYRAALDGAISSGDTSLCKGQPLPFTLQITTAGIGGFRFGQLITTNLIPKTIRDVYYYQVLAVEHDFNNKTGWVTTISTIPRTKFDPNKSTSTGSFDFVDNTIPTNQPSEPLATSTQAAVVPVPDPIQVAKVNLITNSTQTDPNIPNTGGQLFDAQGNLLTLP